MEDVLERYGLTDEKLSKAEEETLMNWLRMIERTEITVEDARKYIRSLRDAAEKEFSEIKRETPDSWLGIATLLIPLLGVIRKWYQDQAELGLKHRIRNYILLEAFLSGPERARKALERQMAQSLPKVKKEEV